MCTVLSVAFSNDKTRSLFTPENLDQVSNLNMDLGFVLLLLIDICSN